MRKLNCEFEKKFENEFSPIIDFVKNNKDVFLGIRNNCIDLYVDGGRILEIKYDDEKKNYIAGIDEKYFKNCPNKMPEVLRKNSKNYINHMPIEKIENWVNILDKLKEVVSDYQNNRIKDLKSKKREKILQQKLVHEFNEKNDYFAYDIEYVIEGLNDYMLDASIDHKPALDKENKIRNPKTLGRADIMLISKPIENKIKVYLMEVKEGKSAFGGVLSNNSKNQSAPSFGSGIVGHLKNNVEIINCARNNTSYVSKYRKELFEKKKKTEIIYEFDIRKILLEEIKYCLHFYKKYNLLPKGHFAYDIDIEKIEISNDKDAIELVFFLGNYKDNGSFENYLGIGNEKKNSAYSVKALLNNKMKNEINLNYIDYKDLFDFKVIKEEKNCDDHGFKLDIEHEYYTVHKEDFLENKNDKNIKK